MSSTLFPAWAAVVFAVMLSVLLLVPFAAFQYRRRGGLSVALVVIDFAILLYVLALATYTLLPLPARTTDFCTVHTAQPQLLPGRFVLDILRESATRSGVTGLLLNPALLQVLFNIALFVPLGMIVRHYGRRTVLVAALTGLAVSALIEFTQLTGDWFLYPCAYRLFDVDDLIANTGGALLGALLAPALRLLPDRGPTTPDRPRPVTAVRRLLGMACDWLVVSLGGLTVTIVFLSVVQNRTALPTPADDFLRIKFGTLVFTIVQLVAVLRTGRTIGEAVVRLQPVDAGTSGRRLLRWLIGIGGWSLLNALPSPIGGTAAGIALLAAVVLVFTTRNHRGLPHLAAGWYVQDDRADLPAEAPAG